MKQSTTIGCKSQDAIAEFADCYLVYLRRSTDDNKNQQNSLEYQLAQCLRYAKDLGLRIAPVAIESFCEGGVIREKHTAYKTNGLELEASGRVSFEILRPKFQRLVGYLEKRQFRGVIAYSLDRLTRNDLDKSIVKQMLRSGTIDVRTVIADYDKSSAGDLHFDVDGMFAAHYSRVTSERVRAACAKLIGEGKWPVRAPIGYLDNGPGDKPLDPVRAPLVKQILELAATGEWSVSQLYAWATKHGLTNKPWRGNRTAAEILNDDGDRDRPAVSRPISAKQIEKILHNPFYAGIVQYGHLRNRGVHTALISEETLRDIQRGLKARTTSLRYADDRRFFVYRGLVRCACGCTFSPYEQKKHVYYRPNCSRPCTQRRPNLSEAAIDEIVTDILARVRYCARKLARLEEKRPSLVARVAQERETTAKLREHQRLRVSRELKYLDDNKLMLLAQGMYTVEQYVEEAARLKDELKKLDGQAQDVSSDAKLAALFKFSELVGMAQHSYKLAKPEQKHRVLLWMTSELVIGGDGDEKKASSKAKDGFQLEFDREVSSLGAPKLILSKLDSVYVAVSKSLEDAPLELGA